MTQRQRDLLLYFAFGNEIPRIAATTAALTSALYCAVIGIRLR